MASCIAITLFIWGLICYVVGVATPWAYLSIKNAYGENLGITEEGRNYVPLVVQNKTCDTVKMTVQVWRGICTDGDTGSCNGFGDSSYWSAVDTLNENYAQYYKHAITTDFEGDAAKWSIVQALVAFSLAVLVMVIVVYFYVSAKGDIALLEKTSIYCSVALTLTCVASFSAVGVSLSTYALAHQFFTGGGYYVKGWFVFSQFVQGCEGPQYLPGPGIFMHPFGALALLLLAMVLPCQCMMPRAREETLILSPASAPLLEAVVEVEAEPYEAYAVAYRASSRFRDYGVHKNR